MLSQLHAWSGAKLTREKEAFSAQEAPLIPPPLDAGARVGPASAPALAPPPAAPPPAAVESPALPAPPASSAPAIYIGARLRAAGRYYSVNGGPNASVV